MKIVVGGPPYSGKSVFTAGLTRAIRARQREQPYHLSFSWCSLDVVDNSLASLLNEDGLDRRDDVEFTQERAEERSELFRDRDE